MKKYTSIYIMLILLVITCIICLILPSGEYIDGEFNYINSSSNVLIETLNAPINGFIGINDGDSISYLNSGTMSGVFLLSLLIISIFIFINIILETKIIEQYLSRRIKFIKKNLKLFVITLIFFFSLAAFTHGMYETTIPIAIILFKVFNSIGINKTYVVKIILYSTSIGYMGSTVNPFATKLASDLANVSLSEGFVSRLVLFIILLIITIYVLLKDLKNNFVECENIEINSKINISNYDILLIIFPFLYMSYSFLPFDLPMKLNMYYLCLLFLISALYFGIKYLKSVTTTIDKAFVSIVSCLPVIIVLSISRGIYVLLFNTNTDDTIIYYLTLLLNNTSSLAIILILFMFYFIFAILIPSSSAIAFITIPIISSALLIVGFDNSLLVTIYQSSIGIVHIFSLTSVVVLTLLHQSNISYSLWIKICYKYVLTITLVTIVILLISNYLL